AALGRTVTGRRQRKTWNLSSIWRLDTDTGPVWVKEVPPFFAHEGALLRWLDRPTAPTVLGVDGGRLLVADIPGDDRHEAPPDERVPMLTDLLDIQASTIDRLPELLALGVPDRRAQPLRELIEDVVERVAGPEERAVLERFVAELPERFA